MEDDIEEWDHGFGGVYGAASTDRVNFCVRAGVKWNMELSILEALTSASGSI